MKTRLRACFSSLCRLKLDAQDLAFLKYLAGLGVIMVGIWMVYAPAALIVGGMGYLGYGVIRRWL